MSWLSKPPIVVPYDFSAEARDAVLKAIDLLGDASGVHVVHVLGELSQGEPGEVWHTVDTGTRTQHATKAIQKELADSKFAGVQVKIAFGDPGHKITEYAAKIGATAIVIPSHGRSQLMRILLGSVADRVVRLAKCPVIILRSDRPD